METKHFQNIVIGFGKGGKTMAKFLATKGENVALIEEDEAMYGGTCINVGCIPSKSLVVSSHKNIAFDRAITEKRTLIGKLRNKNFHMIADESVATVINAKAKFITDYKLELAFKDGIKQTITADRIFINTGAKTIIPNIAGLKESKNIITSKEALDLDVLPEKLFIIGSGYIGLEFASMYSKYGSKVTVVDSFKEFLYREDTDVSNKIIEDLTNSGIEFHLGVTINNIKDIGNKTEITFATDKGEKVEIFDKILVATGRKANIDGLGIENTNIALTEQGAIKVNDILQTSVENIYALGDVRGSLQFTYISLDDFRIVQNQLFGDKTRSLKQQNPVPYSVFMETPLSVVGINEKEAIKKGINYKLYKLDVANVPKAHILKNAKGLFKALVDPNTDEILGATIYSEESYEIINIIALAIKAKISYKVLRDQIFTHPTMAEAINDLFK